MEQKVTVGSIALALLCLKGEHGRDWEYLMTPDCLEALAIKLILSNN